MTPAPRLRRSFLNLLVASATVVLSGVLVSAALTTTPAFAANVNLSQCNGINAGTSGASTGMACDVTIVNTINGSSRSSTTTVTRTCSLDPCGAGNGTFTTSSPDLVTSVDQCNDSGNDSAATTTCRVTITNNISADTPGAEPRTAATVNQCVGSAQGGGGSNTCSPFPATTTSANVTQCNGSANGGGGTIACTVDPSSQVSPALPITVNQCNGTRNKGGSTVRCSTVITTNITSASGGSTGGTGGTSSSGGTSGSSGASSTGGTGGTSGTGGTGSGTGGSSGTSGTAGTGSGTGGSGGTSGTGGAGTSGTTGATPLPGGSNNAGSGGTGGGGSAATGGSTGTSGDGQVDGIPRGGVGAGGGSTSGTRNPLLLALGLVLLLAAGLLAALRRHA